MDHGTWEPVGDRTYAVGFAGIDVALPEDGPEAAIRSPIAVPVGDLAVSL